MPGLTGDYFGGTLTYVCEHDKEGAFGLMLNRPSTVSLLELFVQLGLKADRKWAAVAVLEGGPVATERGFVLHSGDCTFESSIPTGGGIYLATALDVLEAIADDRGPAHFVATLGYAGWGAGQLEAEIQNNVWLTSDAHEEVIFEVPAEQRLNAAAQRLGIDLRLIAGRAGHA